MHTTSHATLTRAAPRSAKREITVSGDLVRSLPTARGYNALIVLVPGVVTNTNDTVVGPAATAFPFHGGRTSEGRLLIDGLTVGSPPAGNAATGRGYLAQSPTFVPSPPYSGF